MPNQLDEDTALSLYMRGEITYHQMIDIMGDWEYPEPEED